MKLDQSRIVSAALDLVADDGLDKFSMRKLAQRLDVQSPAFYWHIGDKAELLALMARHIHAEVRAKVPPVPDWRDWLITFGRMLRNAMLGLRDGARLCACSTVDAADLKDRNLNDAEIEDIANAITQPLVSRGLKRSDALAFHGAVMSLALGWAIHQQNRYRNELISKLYNIDDAFETSLIAMVNGFSKNIQEKAKSKTVSVPE